MGKKLGLDAAYANLGKGYLQHPVINSVKPKPKPTKAMGGGMMRYDAGGMMQGYGAARTSGMGLEDQSLMPGQMVKARFGDFMNIHVCGVEPGGPKKEKKSHIQRGINARFRRKEEQNSHPKGN